MRKPLENTTFIIPLRVESADRLRNIELCLKYLTRWFDSEIIIGSDEHQPVVEAVIKNVKDSNKEITNKITYVCFETKVSDAFHRTYLLNSMLNMVETPVTVNYDCDVVLPIQSYLTAEKMIIEENYDLVYPFGNTQTSQKRVEIGNQVEKFIQLDYNLDFIEDLSFDWPAAYGFCQFFNTISYKNNGGESESFIAYGPEDVERYERWFRLDKKIGRIDDLVFHFEHSRTPNSSPANSYMKKNEEILEIIRKMNDNEFSHYVELLFVDQIKTRIEYPFYLKTL